MGVPLRGWTDASYNVPMAAVLPERSLTPTVRTVADLRTAIEDVVGDKFKLEILGGELIVSPLARSLHLIIVTAVRRALDHVCDPEEFAVTERAELVVDEENSPQPDITILRQAMLEEALYATRYPAGEALLVVEVASPSNGEDDRRWGKKYKAYAKGMVPIYLLIDPYDERGPMISLFTEPNGRRYQVETCVLFGTPVTLPEPFPATIESSKFPVPVDEG
jgi:Uma2 family endonuclease